MGDVRLGIRTTKARTSAIGSPTHKTGFAQSILWIGPARSAAVGTMPTEDETVTLDGFVDHSEKFLWHSDGFLAVATSATASITPAQSPGTDSTPSAARDTPTCLRRGDPDLPNRRIERPGPRERRPRWVRWRSAIACAPSDVRPRSPTTSRPHSAGARESR